MAKQKMLLDSPFNFLIKTKIFLNKHKKKSKNKNKIIFREEIKS